VELRLDEVVQGRLEQSGHGATFMRPILPVPTGLLRSESLLFVHLPLFVATDTGETYGVSAPIPARQGSLLCWAIRTFSLEQVLAAVAGFVTVRSVRGIPIDGIGRLIGLTGYRQSSPLCYV